MNPSYNLRHNVEAVERATIRYALVATNGHRRHTAALLGISLRMLFYKMKSLGLR
jgi:DNA-binding NtrC family response regulator